MTDYTELKRLAEAAAKGDWSGAKAGEFMVAANPAAVLALIAENERLRADLDGEMTQARDFNIEHEELKSERDQLKAENETLRKDAERFKWASSGVQEAETLVSIVSCHGGYAEKIGERIDVYLEASKESDIDAGMGKGEQP